MMNELILKVLDRQNHACYNLSVVEKGRIAFFSWLNISEVKKMRVKITMACQECKQRNYDTMKNKKNNPDRIEMNKYCRFCKKHTAHKETK